MNEVTKQSKDVDFKIENGKLIISVDTNNNGIPVVKLEVDIMEIPSEIMDALNK